jgi:hypothetical protein
MKWDKLEAYIKDNKEGLDDLKPPASVWASIENSMQPVVGKSRMIYWQAAAVIFFALSIGLLVKNYQTNTVSDNYAVIDPEFSDTEQYYFNIIQDKENVLLSSLQAYPNLAEDFKSDLQELTANYEKLKSEFAHNKSTEVLTALIQNLQLQQELLNEQLNIIHLINEENESISI